jgi:hypothetical protein
MHVGDTAAPHCAQWRVQFQQRPARVHSARRHSHRPLQPSTAHASHSRVPQAGHLPEHHGQTATSVCDPATGPSRGRESSAMQRTDAQPYASRARSAHAKQHERSHCSPGMRFVAQNRLHAAQTERSHTQHVHSACQLGSHEPVRSTIVCLLGVRVAAGANRLTVAARQGVSRRQHRLAATAPGDAVAADGVAAALGATRAAHHRLVGAVKAPQAAAAGARNGARKAKRRQRALLLRLAATRCAAQVVHRRAARRRAAVRGAHFGSPCAGDAAYARARPADERHGLACGASAAAAVARASAAHPAGVRRVGRRLADGIKTR